MTHEELIDTDVSSLELDELKKFQAELEAAIAAVKTANVSAYHELTQLEKDGVDSDDDRMEAAKDRADSTDEELAALDEKLDEVTRRWDEDLWCVIDGELVNVDDVDTPRRGIPTVSEGRREWCIAEDSASAGQYARDYWEDMAENAPKEFTCMVGEETLVQWGLGRSAGPGSTHVCSLEEWLDLWLDTPEEQWASYDGSERDVDFASEALVEELGFTPTVAYRRN